MNNEFLQTEEAIVAMLKTVYDPEIPVNVYDLGLIYNIEVDDEKNVCIDMTLTQLSCRRFHSGRCPDENRVCRRREQCGSKPRVRA